jgi:sulfotransferase family protein
VTTGAPPQPIFLLSLPRSGSTLVQRVLASHEEVATTPEPWVLLPQVYAMRERGAYAEYVQVSAARAIREFAQGLPGGAADYDDELRAFVLRLYARAAPSAPTYFLDKTPRYHLIVEELFRLFPDARFIFLWRNPLAVAASIVETWAGGRWAVDRWRVDLFDGIENITTGFETHVDRAIAVRFEDLVSDPSTSWSPIFDHLGLAFDPALLSAFAKTRLEARMGDPTGADSYGELSTEPLDKWKRTLSGPVRKRWARTYLEWIGDHRLSLMGYDLATLRGELDAIPSGGRHVGSDVARGSYWRLDRVGREQAARLLWRRLPR